MSRRPWPPGSRGRPLSLPSSASAWAVSARRVCASLQARWVAPVSPATIRRSGPVRDDLDSPGYQRTLLGECQASRIVFCRHAACAGPIADMPAGEGDRARVGRRSSTASAAKTSSTPTRSGGWSPRCPGCSALPTRWSPLPTATWCSPSPGPTAARTSWTSSGTGWASRRSWPGSRPRGGAGRGTPPRLSGCCSPWSPTGRIIAGPRRGDDSVPVPDQVRACSFALLGDRSGRRSSPDGFGFLKPSLLV